jgi:ABC-type lipoprotein export system ATPase subunit
VEFPNLREISLISGGEKHSAITDRKIDTIIALAIDPVSRLPHQRIHGIVATVTMRSRSRSRVVAHVTHVLDRSIIPVIVPILRP